VKHELYYNDEKQVVILRIRGEFPMEEATETVSEMRELTNGKGSVSILTDKRKAPAKLDREVREVMKDLSKNLNISKTALVVPSQNGQQDCGFGDGERRQRRLLQERRGSFRLVERGKLKGVK
jgi:hypothetical protein